MTTASSQLTDYDAMGRPRADDMGTLSAPLSTVLTDELDGAAAALGVSCDEILVAALGRALQRTVGVGAVSIDMPGHGATTPLVLPCVTPEHTSATDLLAGIHRSLADLPPHRVMHGLLGDPSAHPPADVLFCCGDATVGHPRRGHLLELRARRGAATWQLEWSYDTRSFEPYTVQELAEQFPLALIEVTSEAAPPLAAVAELAMAH